MAEAKVRLGRQKTTWHGLAPMARVAAVVIGVILILAAVEKAAAPKATIHAVESLLALVAGGTPRLSRATAVLPLCILELVLGALLFAGVAQRAAALATLAFLTLATAAVITLALHRPGQACGCGMRWLTLGHDLGPWGVVGRNIVLAAMAIIVAFPRRRADISAPTAPLASSSPEWTLT